MMLSMRLLFSVFLISCISWQLVISDCFLFPCGPEAEMTNEVCVNTTTHLAQYSRNADGKYCECCRTPILPENATNYP